MFRFAFLAGIAYFIGQLAYRVVQFVLSLIIITFLLSAVFVLDAIRLAG
jgi:hypothetical protein